jgi:hypothetical protein
VGTGGISSYDPDALPKLRAERPGLDDTRMKMKPAIYAIKRQARADVTDVRLEGRGYAYREDLTENRVMFEFSVKPAPDTRDAFEAECVQMVPNQGAWVRRLPQWDVMPGSWSVKP